MAESTNKKQAKTGSEDTLKILAFVASVVLLLFFSSIAAILYASGKVPTRTGNLRELGAIRINSIPEDVSIELNGEKLSTSDHIANLEPGEYNLNISKEGYIPVEKTVLVRPELVEDLFVRLYPEELALNQLNDQPISNLVFSEDGNYIYYLINDKNGIEENGIWREKISKSAPITLFSNTNQKLLDITPELETLLVNYNLSLHPSPDDRSVILRFTPKTNTGLSSLDYILSSENLNKLEELESLEDIVPIRFDRIDWLYRSETLIIQSGNTLAEYNINNQEINLIYLTDGDLIYTISNGDVYYYNDKENEIYVYQSGASQPLEINALNINDPIIKLNSSKVETEMFTYINSENDLFYVNPEANFISKIASNAELVSISRNGNNLLYRNLNSGIYKAVTVDEIPLLDQLEIEQFEIELPAGIETDDISRINYAPAGDSIILKMKNDSLYLLDTEGKNAVELYKPDVSERLVNYQLNTNSSSLYLSIEQEFDTEGTEVSPQKQRNLFEISLVVD